MLNSIDFKGRRVIPADFPPPRKFRRTDERRSSRPARKLVEQNPDVELIYPVHPNPNVRKAVKEILSNVPRVHLIEPMEYRPFVQLMNKSYLILTDSGGVQEEAPSPRQAGPGAAQDHRASRSDRCRKPRKLVGTDRKQIVQTAQKAAFRSFRIPPDVDEGRTPLRRREGPQNGSSTSSSAAPGKVEWRPAIPNVLFASF